MSTRPGRGIRALLRLRAHREQRATQQLATAETAVRDAVAVRDAAARTPSVFSAPVAAETARALRAVDVGAYEQLRSLYTAVDDAEVARDRAYLAWSREALARRQLERLEERRRRQRVVAAGAARQRALDAAAVARWGWRR